MPYPSAEPRGLRRCRAGRLAGARRRRRRSWRRYRCTVRAAGSRPGRRARSPSMQFGAQAAVGADAAGDHQQVAISGIEAPFALDREGVDHRVLEAAGDVGTGLRRLVAVAPGQQHWVLSPLKLKSTPGDRSSAARIGICRARRSRPAPPAAARRVGQAHELAVLSKASPRHRRGSRRAAVAADASTATSGYAAGHQQRTTAARGGRDRICVLHQRRQQVAFHVVDADRRQIQRQASDRATPAPTSRAPTSRSGGVARRRGRDFEPASARVWRTSGSSLRT